MIKCKDCKVFSPQSECGGICGFTNFGTVKNDDGCPSGAIINDIYNLGRADAINEYKNALKEDINNRLKSVEKYLEAEPLDAWRQATRTFKVAIVYFARQLKEQKNE